MIIVVLNDTASPEFKPRAAGWKYVDKLTLTVSRSYQKVDNNHALLWRRNLPFTDKNIIVRNGPLTSADCSKKATQKTSFSGIVLSNQNGELI